MKPIKLQIKLVDKDKIFTLKGKYDPENRIATAKRKLFDKTPLKFQVDPTHIYFEGRKRVCYVDNASRTSRSIHSDAPIDQKAATSLNLLIDQAFWKGIMEKRKISGLTAFALLLAGVGLYTILVTILRVAGINV
ncbi:MAG: hypothetical protein QXG08_06305 [Candidatus Methanomethyliaceae archaeon]